MVDGGHPTHRRRRGERSAGPVERRLIRASIDDSRIRRRFETQQVARIRQRDLARRRALEPQARRESRRSCSSPPVPACRNGGLARVPTVVRPPSGPTESRVPVCRRRLHDRTAVRLRCWPSADCRWRTARFDTLASGRARSSTLTVQPSLWSLRASVSEPPAAFRSCVKRPSASYSNVEPWLFASTKDMRSPSADDVIRVLFPPGSATVARYRWRQGSRSSAGRKARRWRSACLRRPVESWWPGRHYQ